MIDKDQIEEVRSRADIVQIISGMLPLKKSGKDYKACCPFHEEKTPSFYVVPSKGCIFFFTASAGIGVYRGSEAGRSVRRD